MPDYRFRSLFPLLLTVLVLSLLLVYYQDKSPDPPHTSVFLTADGFGSCQEREEYARQTEKLLKNALLSRGVTGNFFGSLLRTCETHSCEKVRYNITLHEVSGSYNRHTVNSEFVEGSREEQLNMLVGLVASSMKRQTYLPPL